MANFDYTPGGTYGGAATVTRVNGVATITSRIVDLAGHVGTTDTIDIFDLKAGMSVLAASFTVVQATGVTCTMDVGISGGDDDGYIAAANANGTAGTSTAGTGALLVGTVGGNVLAADSTVRCVSNTGATFTAGRFFVTLVVAGLDDLSL